ncbi:MAG: ATP-binding protein [Pseudomonadota bacterium]
MLNACQATGAGGQVRLRAERRQAVLRLAVEDDGPGVPKEQRLDVVTPFFTTKRGGTGLGLAVAHQIARAHDGELQIEDVEGGGARFVLELPAPEP